MTKFRLIGAAAVVSTVLAGPAMAQHLAAHPGHYARSTDCATIESGNPYSRVHHYGATSGWRNPIFSAERVYDGPDPLLPFGE
jgi:hypothetical protein